jgi:hypothetical protein
MSRDSSFRSPLASFAAAVAIAAVVIGGTYGCHQESSPTEPLPGQTTTLAVRQTTTIAAGVALSFDRVLSDSRCPSGVVFAWEGEVTVALTLSESSGTATFTLSDHSPTRVVGGYSFQLVSIQPIPNAGTAIPEGAYRATIRASR